MAVVTVGDMLDLAQDFETRLETYYADLRDRAESGGVKLLTHYLARHRHHLPGALEALSAEELAHVRKIPFRSAEYFFEPEKQFEGRALASSVSGKELLEVAITFVEQLIRFYRWMAGQPLGEEASQLFRDLLRVEEKHVIELKKTLAMDYF